MEQWDFLKELADEYQLDVTVDDIEVILTDQKTGEHIDIYVEKYLSEDLKDTYVEYIVCFSTQHVHLENLSDVAEYVRLILADEVLPIEFYLQGERRFGGEIKHTDLDGLTIEFLADHYGYSVEYLSQFDYEIHSWSGKYNREQTKVSE